jgi:hypothetical protein
MTIWIAATLALAQPPAPPPSAAPSVPGEAEIEARMQAAVGPTFQAWVSCLTEIVEATPDRVPAAEAAAAIIASCRDRQQALAAAHAAFLASEPLGDALRESSRSAWAASMDGIETQLVRAIEAMRGQPD